MRSRCCRLVSGLVAGFLGASGLGAGFRFFLGAGGLGADFRFGLEAGLRFLTAGGLGAGFRSFADFFVGGAFLGAARLGLFLFGFAGVRFLALTALDR